jgi:hypothetical protein
MLYRYITMRGQQNIKFISTIFRRFRKIAKSGY